MLMRYLVTGSRLLKSHIIEPGEARQEEVHQSPSNCRPPNQPIAAILMNDAVYQGADQSHSIGTLGHGFTGSGHPVAAAVALENLKIIEEEGLVQHAAEMGMILRKGLQQFADHPLVGEVRGVGLIAAVELVATGIPKSPLSRSEG
jgi:4-aminobutyrate--pyruvate transaminase